MVKTKLGRKDRPKKLQQKLPPSSEESSGSFLADYLMFLASLGQYKEGEYHIPDPEEYYWLLTKAQRAKCKSSLTKKR